MAKTSPSHIELGRRVRVEALGVLKLLGAPKKMWVLGASLTTSNRQADVEDLEAGSVSEELSAPQNRENYWPATATLVDNVEPKRIPPWGRAVIDFQHGSSLRKEKGEPGKKGMIYRMKRGQITPGLVMNNGAKYTTTPHVELVIEEEKK
jgi:hypothetical protein